MPEHIRTGRRKSVMEHVAEYVSYEPAHGCWVWLGTKDRAGYGVMRMTRDGRSLRPKAHRAVYEAMVGPLGGWELDHTCHNRACVNPSHLRPCSHRDNMGNLRGKSSGRYSSKHVGVSWHSRSRRWRAFITIKGKSIYLGSFDVEGDAGAAYQRARADVE